MFEVVKDKISTGNRLLEVPGIKIIKELSRGANGIVYLGLDEILDREVAVKIWTKLRNNDSRNKVLQGIKEVRKILNAKRQPKKEFHMAEPYESLFYDAIVEIYSAGFLEENIFFVVMELVEGVTLKDWLPENQYPIGKRFYIAEALTELDAQWSSTDIYHGDLHWKNVMVQTDTRPKAYWEGQDRPPILRILDFGTSQFVIDSKSKERHFKVLAETVAHCLYPIPLDEILPHDKPANLGSVETREWIQRSLLAFRAALFSMGRSEVGWPYYISDAYLGYKVPNHTDYNPAKKLIEKLGILQNTNIDTLGRSNLWSEFDGRRDKHPGD